MTDTITPGWGQPPKVLVLAPTRELAKQVSGNINIIAYNYVSSSKLTLSLLFLMALAGG